MKNKIKYIFVIFFAIYSINSFSQNITLYFPVTHHIIVKTDGTGSQNVNFIPEIMAELNRAFAPAGIQFYMSCVGIDTIRNDTLFNFDNVGFALSRNINYLGNNHYISGTINIYYANYIVSSRGFVTTTSNDKAIIVLEKMENTFPFKDTAYPTLVLFNTAIHEMGHYFGLYHTFHNYRNPFLRENPDFSNCIAAGDYVCDTPADTEYSGGSKYHYNSFDTNNNCFHCYQSADSFYYAPNNWWYKPDIHNYMSYTGNWCWEHFSNEQMDRMYSRAISDTFTTRFGYPYIYISMVLDIIKYWDWEVPDLNPFFASYGDCDGELIIPTDTILYKRDRIETCLKKGDSNIIEFSPNAFVLENASWYINNSLVKEGTDYGFMNSSGFYFHLFDYDSLWNTSTYTDDYIIVEARLQNEEKYIFKFKVYDNSEIVSQLSKYWEDAGLDFELVGNTANLNIDLTNTVTIPLPSLPDCQLEINMADSVDWNSDSDNITISPTEVCDFTGQLRYNCECNGFINLNIHNTGCDDLCEKVEWTVTSYLDKDTCGNRIVTVSATISDTSRKIVKAEHGRYDSYYDNYSIEEVYEYPDGVLTTSRTFSLGCYSTSGEWHPFDPIIEHNEFKITLDNSKECSKVFPYGYGSGICCRTFLDDMIAHPNPDINGNIIVNCKFSSMPQGPIILSIIDLQGVTRIPIYEGMVTSLISQFSANVNNLQPGSYYIKLESPLDNELIFTPFIKQ